MNTPAAKVNNMSDHQIPRDLGLPIFPWDTLIPYKKRALAHPGGIVDLSVGTPVDDTPEVIQQALRDAANAPGYPTVYGSIELRESIANWCREIRGASRINTQNCFPTLGSKELVANLCWQLGVRPGDKVLFPQVAYPTYDISARLAGAQGIAVGHDYQQWPTDAVLVWINTPGNPDGWVASVDWLVGVACWARQHGVIVVSDECYAQLNWESADSRVCTPSLISDSVLEQLPKGDGDPLANLLLVYSLSKQSNLAGYRASFVAGAQNLITSLVEVRKHSGFMVPAPNQAALQVALGQQELAVEQAERYRWRREKLLKATRAAGLVNHPESKAGLYLWMTCKEWEQPGEKLKNSYFNDQNLDYEGKEKQNIFNSYPGQISEKTQKNGRGWEIVSKFADLGILVAPGDFYGGFSGDYVRIALSATDEQILAACERLSNYCF